MSACIIVVSNGKNSTINLQPFTITYNQISIKINSSNDIQQLAQSNSYDVQVGSDVVLSSNSNNVYLQGNATYQ
ncbi:hypothetical protein IKS57_05665 [bacterium]|nr:hypothetical protein [bacterium]